MRERAMEGRRSENRETRRVRARRRELSRGEGRPETKERWESVSEKSPKVNETKRERQTHEGSARIDGEILDAFRKLVHPTSTPRCLLPSSSQAQIPILVEDVSCSDSERSIRRSPREPPPEAPFRTARVAVLDVRLRRRDLGAETRLRAPRDSRSDSEGRGRVVSSRSESVDEGVGGRREGVFGRRHLDVGRMSLSSRSGRGERTEGIEGHG